MVTYFGWKSIHYWKRIHTRSASSQDLIFEAYAFQILRHDLAIFRAMSSKFRDIYMSLSYCNFYDMSQNLKDTSPNLATCCNVLAMLCDIVPHVLNFCDMLKIKWKKQLLLFSGTGLHAEQEAPTNLQTRASSGSWVLRGRFWSRLT